MAERHRKAAAENRTQAQRERILDAARKCFVAHGFHAASMANIAETAGMSPGLIYRYFENKSAIILAIIERHLADARTDIAMLQSDTDLLPVLLDLFTQWQSGDAEQVNPALLLEMTAEATRDPQIAGALAAADRVTGEDLQGWLEDAARHGGCELAEPDIKAHAFVLRCFLGGLAIRAIREPDLDRSVLRDGLRLVLSTVLSFSNP
jgi:AcrR family transcriptional regulator